MDKIRLLLVDDHALVRAGIKSLLELHDELEIVGEAGEADTALALAHELQPDLVILDISLPGMSGAHLAVKLRAANPTQKILVLTMHEERSYPRLLLEAGASGYMLKSASTDQLVHAIRTVAAGGTFIDPTLAARVVGSYLGSEEESHSELSQREEEVIRLIARGLSNKEIAARLDLSVKTIETYKARSMEKLGIRTRAGFVQFAIDRGWLSSLQSS